MRKWYIIYIIYFICFFTFFLYYAVCFAAVYKYSTWGWIWGGIFSLILKFFVFEIIGALFITTVRQIARMNPGSK